MSPPQSVNSYSGQDITLNCTAEGPGILDLQLRTNLPNLQYYSVTNSTHSFITILIYNTTQDGTVVCCVVFDVSNKPREECYYPGARIVVLNGEKNVPPLAI